MPKRNLNIDRLFIRDDHGRIALRRGNVWSSYGDCCLDCKRTDRPHEAFGRCRACYAKWKRATDPEWAERKRILHKQGRLRNADKIEERDKSRARDPKRLAMRRVISNRYAEKHAKWPLGSTVWHQVVPGTWIKGTIASKTNTCAFVQFATLAEKIPFARLSKQQPFQIMEVA